MTKSKFMPLVVLSAICVVVALLLAVVNMFTAPIIKAAMENQANEALVEVLPEGKSFEKLDISEGYPDVVTEAYRETNGKGYVFQMKVTGYKSGLVIMCGISSDGQVSGTKYIQSSETNGAEDKLDGKYNGMNKDSLNVEIIAGSTLTSKAYHKAVEAALNAFVIAQGGSVDLRDEATVLQDNCNAALGTEGAVFEKWFDVEGIGSTVLYISEEGCVAYTNEMYVGIDNGEPKLQGVSAKTGEIGPVGDAAYIGAKTAYEIYSSSSLTELSVPEGANKNVLAVSLTDSGNYVFELQAAGYGIMGDWNNSGEYIKLKVAISSDGRIISTLTTYENESDNIGDVAGKPSYYEQFNGTDAESYGDVQNVTGATVTTSGYKKAIGYAFEAFEILTGGATNE